ncbi:MAG: hypothetical protein A3G23_00155 [Bacteroidetes bacterium RIFCSPLOWO2_12_FULL_37_12]|nr:MAG: hypothetical protein A3G23_00155 [Bacteroidetes bacterium RIFCSPLOWO2_12_FULL_37_12]
MAYQISPRGKGFLSKIHKNGKEKELVPPSYNPPLQTPFDILSILCAIATVGLIVTGFFMYGFIAAGIAILLFSIRELFIQDDHSIVRIYGPFGRLRYLIEDALRDKIMQYFTETNTEGRPIPKIVRNYIYARAHNAKSLTSFGTEVDITDTENTASARILHRNFPGEIQKASYSLIIGEQRPDIKTFKVKSCINVSAMSFGSLNYKACESISFGTKDIAYCNTGEGGYGPHGVAGNDVVFQIGTGKFGVGKDCVLNDGTPSRILDDELLKNLVNDNPNIKMLQIKISQGAKPGLGGVLPGAKVTPEIAAVRKVKPWQTVVSPPQHTEIIGSTPKETIVKLIEFIQKLRKLSNLPVGIKFCIGRLEEIDLLVSVMLTMKDGPDAIQVDGADGGTGAGPSEFVNYVGYGSVIESMAYLHKKLQVAGLRDKVVLSASGKLFTPSHAAVAFAYGADIIDTARGAMLALGCIQALRCHTGECPTGITTHNSWRMHGIDIPEKSTRVHFYLKGFHDDMLQLTHVLGRTDPRDIKPQDVRIMSKHKNEFQKYFEEDPFGLFMPTPEKMIADALQ